jgi:hypothetical protein
LARRSFGTNRQGREDAPTWIRRNRRQGIEGTFAPRESGVTFGQLDPAKRVVDAVRTHRDAEMADETKRRGPDRVKVARFQGYEPRYLARKYGITLEQARILIKRTGRDRVKLNKSAKRLARKRLKAQTT